MSPRSIRFASSTSWARRQQRCRPASRRKSCSASVVVSTRRGRRVGEPRSRLGLLDRARCRAGRARCTPPRSRAARARAARGSPAARLRAAGRSPRRSRAAPRAPRFGGSTRSRRSRAVLSLPRQQPVQQAKHAATTGSRAPATRNAVHENGRYVKLEEERTNAERSIVPTVRRIALAAAVASALLGAAGPARAESVPASTGATDAVLAVAPDGSPRVAFVGAAGAVVVAARAADGTWTEQALPALPGPRVLVVGLAVAPSGRTVVLAEDPAAHWLALAEQNGASWSVRTVATRAEGRPPRLRRPRARPRRLAACRVRVPAPVAQELAAPRPRGREGPPRRRAGDALRVPVERRRSRRPLRS